MGKIKYLGKTVDFIKDEWFSIYSKIFKEPHYDRMYYINFQKNKPGHNFTRQNIWNDDSVSWQQYVSQPWNLFKKDFHTYCRKTRLGSSRFMPNYQNHCLDTFGYLFLNLCVQSNWFLRCSVLYWQIITKGKKEGEKWF